MRTQRVRARPRLVESANRESRLQDPGEPILERRVPGDGRELLRPSPPFELEHLAIEVAIDAQPALVPGGVALPLAEWRVGARMSDRGNDSSIRPDHFTKRR